MTIEAVRNHPLVQALHNDEGWWCHLIEGYWIPSMECGTIHETTINEVARLLRTAEVEPSWYTTDREERMARDRARQAAIAAEQAMVVATARAATGASLGRSVATRYRP